MHRYRYAFVADFYIVPVDDLVQLGESTCLAPVGSFLLCWFSRLCF